MPYEGVLLGAVASAYFLALNALAAYLFLRLAQAREEFQSLRQRVERVLPRLEETMGLGELALSQGSETLKPRRRQRR